MLDEVLKSRWFTAAILIVIGFLVVSIIKITYPVLTAVKEVKNLDQKIEDVKKSDSEQQKLGNYIKSDAYLEQQARLKLNYKKPDEAVVFVYRNLYNQDQPKTNQTQTESNKILELITKPLKNLQGWLGSLLDK